MCYPRDEISMQVTGSREELGGWDYPMSMSRAKEMRNYVPEKYG